MRKYATAILCFGLCLTGCSPKERAQSAAPGKGINSFNPYRHERLPNVRAASAADEQLKGRRHTGSIGLRNCIPLFLAICVRLTEFWCCLTLPRRRVKKYGRL